MKTALDSYAKGKAVPKPPARRKFGEGDLLGPPAPPPAVLKAQTEFFKPEPHRGPVGIGAFLLPNILSILHPGPSEKEKTKEKERLWQDILSGKAEKDAHDAFLAPAEKAQPKATPSKFSLVGGKMTVVPSVPKRQTEAARKQAVKDERARLEAEWQDMKADPEGYADRKSRVGKEPVGMILSAGIGQIPGLPKSVKHDLQSVAAGTFPSVTHLGYDFATGNTAELAALGEGMVEQYKQHYLDGGWRGALAYATQHPVYFGLDIASVALPVTRIASIAKIAKDISAANEGITATEALKLARMESFRPGTVNRLGLNGGIPARVINSTYGKGNEEGRLVSRSPAGRATQKAWDAASQRLDETRPGARFSSSARSAAAWARGEARQDSRDRFEVTQAEINVNKALSRTIRQKVFQQPLTTAEGQSLVRRLLEGNPGVPQQEILHGLIAALENSGLPPNEAIAANIETFKHILTGGISSHINPEQIATMAEGIAAQGAKLTAKQEKGVKALNSRIRAQTKAAEKARARALYLFTHRTQEERNILREGSGLTSAAKRSDSEIVRLNARISASEARQAALNDRVDEWLTRPSTSPSRRNRGLGQAMDALRTESEKLQGLRQELGDALSWGQDVTGDQNRLRLRLGIAESAANKEAKQAGFDADMARLDEAAWIQYQKSIDAKTKEELASDLADLQDQIDLLTSNPRRSTAATPTEVGHINAAVASLEHALEHPTDTAEYARALRGLQEMSKWADELGLQIETIGMAPEEVAAKVEEFAARNRAWGDEMVRRGILTPEQVKGAYFPHRSTWTTTAERRGHHGGGELVTRPEVRPYILERRHNDLQLIQRGLVDISPSTLGNVIRNRLTYLGVMRGVQRLFDVGDPLPAGGLSAVPKHYVLVYDPAKSTRSLSAEQRLAYTDPEQYDRIIAAREKATREGHTATVDKENLARQARGEPALTRAQAEALRADKRSAAEGEVDSFNAQSADPDGSLGKVKDDLEETVYDPGEGKKAPEWTKDTDSIRVVPRRVYQNTLGAAALKHSDGDALSAVNAANMLIRASLLYTSYGGARYVLRNTIQSATLAAITNPGSLLKVQKAVRLQLGSPYEREIFRRLAVEAGTVQASAGLPDARVVSRSESFSKRAEGKVGNVTGAFANTLGDLADEPWRVGVLLQRLSKYDIETPDELHAILTSKDPKDIALLNRLGQQTREDMLDFDTATPAEKAYLNRIIFLYPFLRASLKWPFMFAREYPGRATAAAQSSQIPQDQWEFKNMPRSALEADIWGSGAGRKNWHQWNPYGPAADIVQAGANVLQHPLAGGAAVGDFVNPLLGIGIRWVGGATTQDEFKRLIAPWNDYVKISKGGSIEDQITRAFSMDVKETRQVKKRNDTYAAQVTRGFAANPGVYDPNYIQRAMDLKRDWEMTQERARRAGLDLGETTSTGTNGRLFFEYMDQKVPGLRDQSVQGIPFPSAEQIKVLNDAQVDILKRAWERAIFSDLAKLHDAGS